MKDPFLRNPRWQAARIYDGDAGFAKQVCKKCPQSSVGTKKFSLVGLKTVFTALNCDFSPINPLPSAFTHLTMKPEPSTNMRRHVALSAIGLTTVLATSCAIPQREAWTQINQRGLIPVLIDGEHTAIAANHAIKPSHQDAVRVQAVTTPVVVKTIYADTVPGRSGYVFSPHTVPRKVVDVRGFRAGEEVRCPFTTQPFLVPDFHAVAAASKPAPERPIRTVAEVVSASPNTPGLIDHNLTQLEPAPEMKAVTPAPVEPVQTTPAPATAAGPAKAAIPYGTRVPGRPGFVYSPHAGKTQLVDVAGTAPGVVVKCPYTNKHFRVPEMNTEEIKPGTFPAAPATETADAPPATHDKPAAEEPAPSATPAPPPAPGNPVPSLCSPR